MANLFIIGNGFDLAHGINSSYEDFHKYLQHKYGVVQQSKWTLPYIYPNKRDCNEIDAANLLIRLISIAEKNGNRWCDFENSLGKLDYSRFFQSYNMDEYIEMAQNSLEISIPKIKYFFSNWIKDICINDINKIDAFSKLIDTDKDYFISFNYTQVLEKIYGAKNVCHVHGDINTEIIMGHGDFSNIRLISYDNDSAKNKKSRLYNKKMFKMETDDVDSSKGYLTTDDIALCIFHMFKEGCNGVIEGEIQNRLFKNLSVIEKDIRSYLRNNNTQKENRNTIDTSLQIQEIANALQRIHETLRKDTTKAIISIIKFLSKINQLETIDNIYSIGFSYSNVDMKVIQIISLLGAKSWYLNNYKNDDIGAFIRKIKRCSFEGNINQFDFTKG